MKNILTISIPIFLQHLLCCGALLFFLVSSGYLLILRQEADKKIYLIPGLLVAGLFFLLYRYYASCCKKKGNKNIGDHFVLISLYIIFSFIVGFIFMIYVFIPWWLPTYKGGPLLP